MHKKTIFYITDLEGRIILQQVASSFYYDGVEGLLTIYNDKTRFDSYVESVELISSDKDETVYQATIDL